MNLVNWFNFTNNRKKLRRLYILKKYQTIPEIPSEKESKRILKNYKNFPSSLVPKEYMNPIKFKNLNLLRGEVIELWWIRSRGNIRNPPKYFLYEYGINFFKSVDKLKKLGLLKSNNKIAQLGNGLIQDSAQILWEHKATKSIGSDGKIKYFSSRDVNGRLYEVKKVRYPTKKTIEKMDDYFYNSNARIQYLWNIKQYDQCEKEALEQISRGNKYPTIYEILAKLYRKSKAYKQEACILKQGIQAQVDIHNTGVAKRDFEKHLISVNELIKNTSRK